MGSWAYHQQLDPWRLQEKSQIFYADQRFMTFESIIYGFSDGEEPEMMAVVVGEVASDCLLTSIDSLYTEGKEAMEMLSYKQKSGALIGFCGAVVQSI